MCNKDFDVKTSFFSKIINLHIKTKMVIPADLLVLEHCYIKPQKKIIRDT